jgi:hypothetical protein
MNKFAYIALVGAANAKKGLWSVYQASEYTNRLHANIDEAGRETEQWVEHDAESKEAFEWLAKNH